MARPLPETIPGPTADRIGRQQAHFDSVADSYFTARRHANHLLLKQLMWRDFLGQRNSLKKDGLAVLEAMCGFGDGKAILEDALGIRVAYSGFDYSNAVVATMQATRPEFDIRQADVTRYQADGTYDLVMLLGGLHHVHHAAAEVVERLSRAVKPGGYMLNLEPTNGNAVFRRIRERIYARNSLFDAETERAFEVDELLGFFEAAGLERVDVAWPGLLSYVLYYNPDAFPELNLGGNWAVKAAFGLDRPFFRTRLGRMLSFATLTLWQRPAEPAP